MSALRRCNQNTVAAVHSSKSTQGIDEAEGDDESDNEMTNSSGDWWHPGVPTPPSPSYRDPTTEFAPPTVPYVTPPTSSGATGGSPQRSKRRKLIAGATVAVLIVAAVAVIAQIRGSDVATGGGRSLLRAVPGPDPTKTKLKLDGYLEQATVADGVLYVAVSSGGNESSTDVQAYRLGTEATSLWHKSVDGTVRQLRVISGGLAVLSGTPDSSSNSDSETALSFKSLGDGSDLWKTTIDDESLFDDRFSVPVLRGSGSSGDGSINYHLLSMTEHKVTRTVSLSGSDASVVGGQLVTLDSGRVRTFDAASLQPTGNGFSVDDTATYVTAVGGDFAVAEGTNLVLDDANGKEVTRDNVNVGVIHVLFTIGQHRIVAYGDKGTKVLDINGKNFDEAYSTKGFISASFTNGRTYGLVQRSVGTSSSVSLVNLGSKTVDEIGTFKAGSAECGDGGGSHGEDDGFRCNADRLFNGAIYSLNGDGTLAAYSLDKLDKLYSIHTTGRVLALDGTVLDANTDSNSNSTTLQIFR